MMKKWFAVYTRSRCEKKVKNEFDRIDVENYLPLVKTVKQWSDRKKKCEDPLIRSYVFVHSNYKEFHNILEVYGVVYILKFENKPVSIPDWQIENVKILLNSKEPFEVITDFKKGDFVLITKGSLKGLKGIVNQFNNKKRLIISLDAPEVNFIVDIHSAYVEQIEYPSKK